MEKKQEASLGKCPSCGQGDFVDNRKKKAFHCTKCKCFLEKELLINENIANKKLTKSDVRKLINNEHIKIKLLFNDKLADAYIAYDKNKNICFLTVNIP